MKMVTSLLLATLFIVSCGNSPKTQTDKANKFVEQLKNRHGIKWSVAKSVTQQEGYAVFLREGRDWVAVDISNYTGGDPLKFLATRADAQLEVNFIGGGNYEVMYDSISVFEEETGATVEIVALLDGFAIDQKLILAKLGSFKVFKIFNLLQVSFLLI